MKADLGSKIQTRPPLPHISRRALARVKNPKPAPTVCHYCQGDVELINNVEIYGREYGNWPFAYRCKNCKAYVGLHPHTDIPLGTLATPLLRKARMDNKEKFNLMMRSCNLSRNDAYQWLADQLGIDREDCHWGWFDASECNRAGRICQMRKLND